MKRYYANLLGEWVDLTDDGKVDNQSAHIYFEENLTFEGNSKVARCFEYGYVNVQYGGKNYRIHPEHIQIVTE